MSFTDETFKIKTPFHALMFQCRLESKLQYVLACHWLELRHERSEPTELTHPEDLFYCSGKAPGWFEEKVKIRRNSGTV